MAEGEEPWQGWEIALLIIGILGILTIFFILLIRWYIRRPMYRGTTRIDGKTVVITGANTGIGKETARDLLRRGGKVVLLCRDAERGQKAVDELKEGYPEDSISLYLMDLSDLESVRSCAATLKEKLPKIDILINNAGVMTPPKTETKDGYELQFGTNHLGHFLLTLLLLDNIKAAAPSRIVNVSSRAHLQGSMNWDDIQYSNNYSAFMAYAQSKLANILFSKSLALKLKGSGVTVYSLHPGVIATELGRYLGNTYGCLADVLFKGGKFMLKTPTLGAQTSIYCAVDESIAEESGLYYSGCSKKTPSRKAENMIDAERLWILSLDLVKLPNFEV